MKFRLLTPGPTPVPEETLLEMARPVFYHRSSEFRAILAEVLADLKEVFRTANHVLPLTASGTGALEAAIVNAVPAPIGNACATLREVTRGRSVNDVACEAD